MVKKKSLTEIIYYRLREEIVTCAIAPSTELSEAELAKRFDVSKTPVREALAMLRLDGLVHTYPRRGYEVTPITLADINSLFEARTILEAGAAELACAKISEEELASLEQLARSEYLGESESSLSRFIDRNRQFHLAIARAAGNERIYAMLEKQLHELERFFYLGASLRNVQEETNTDHQQIVEILATRDANEARRAMIRHNTITRQGLLDALTRSPEAGLLRI